MNFRLGSSFSPLDHFHGAPKSRLSSILSFDIFQNRRSFKWKKISGLLYSVLEQWIQTFCTSWHISLNCLTAISVRNTDLCRVIRRQSISSTVNSWFHLLLAIVIFFCDLLIGNMNIYDSNLQCFIISTTTRSLANIITSLLPYLCWGITLISTHWYA